MQTLHDLDQDSDEEQLFTDNEKLIHEQAMLTLRLNRYQNRTKLTNHLGEDSFRQQRSTYAF